MINFVCVLKESKEFTPETVEVLYNQVKRNVSDVNFVCFSDNDSVKCDELRPLTDGLPGWWSIIEAFQYKGPVIFTGLDTVITGEINKICDYIKAMPEHEFMMLRKVKAHHNRNFTNLGIHGWASGIMGWNGDQSWLYKEFNYVQHGQLQWEQRYTSEKLMDRYIETRGHKNRFRITCAQDTMDGIYSYKWDCRNGLPENAKIVLFHGSPRPNEVKELEWMQQHHR
jgi:hypothetical protein